MKLGYRFVKLSTEHYDDLGPDCLTEIFSSLGGACISISIRDSN
jgi:hypothetical protein